MEENKLKYQLIMDYILNEIFNGTLKTGDKIYSENELLQKFGVSRHTVREAIMRLLNEGYVYTVHGKGSFVSRKEDSMPNQRKTSKCIAVISAYINNHTFPATMQEIEMRARAKGLTVMISCTHNQVFQERECLMDILKNDIVGVIVEPTKSELPNPNLDLYRQLKLMGIPVIFINGYYSNFDCDYVVVDDIDAGYKAGNYLISRGHVRIGGIFKSDDMQGHKRYQGMLKAIYENKMVIDESNIIWISTEDEKVILRNPAARKAYFERLKGCTASVCYNDDIAINVAEELIHQGIQIPGQHSIISFDNTIYGTNYRIPITSLDYPSKKIGEASIECLIKKLNSPDEQIHKEFIVDVVEKKSVILLK